MKKHKRRAFAGLTVRDRVALDLRELQLCVRHPMGPMLSVRANARLIIGPEPESDRRQVAMRKCESPMRGTWPDFICIDNPAAAGVPPTVAGDPAPGRRNNGDSQSWISEVGKCGAAAPKRRGAVADDVRERSVRARQSHSRPSDSAHLRQRRGGRTCSSLCGGISARRSLRR